MLHGLAVVPFEQDISKPKESLEKTKEDHEKTEEDLEALHPSVSIVMSPLPIPSWSNLVRMSVTVDPVPGSLHEVLKALNSIHLHCRHMESTNGLDLNKFRVYHSSMRASPNPSEIDGHAEDVARPDLIIPSTLLWIELPYEPPGCLAQEILTLHRQLRNLIENPAQDQYEPKNLLASILSAALTERSLDRETNSLTPIKVSVDWISPLATLNRLGRLQQYSLGQENPHFTWNIRARARKKF